VTFVLTDIEGSTRMFRQLGPAYRPLLEKHNDLLRAVWARHGGVEVKTVGDSFVVAFAVAAEALAAAMAAQRAITSHQWPESAALKIDVYLAFSFILAARMAQDSAQPEAAVELHSAADVILERISFTLMPDDRELSDEMLASARGAVGEDRARELENQGRALPLDQAVEMADRVFAQIMT
jgi:hypothetical protein